MNLGYSAHNSSSRRESLPPPRSPLHHFRGEGSHHGGDPSPLDSGMRPNRFLETMSSSALDAREYSEKSSSEAKEVDKSSAPIARSPVRYESTPSGVVVVVEPSFDAGDHEGGSPGADNMTAIKVEGRSSSPSGDRDYKPIGGHTRNLSEHFYDATHLTASLVEGLDQPHTYGYRESPSSSDPLVGMKHRRVFSGEMSHPPEAHRRINSIGNSASIQRRPHRQQRAHQRVDSAGLDILTAAADASREELAAAAGKHRGPTSSWGEAVHHPEGSQRLPPEATAYDRSSVPHPQRGHHRPYSHGAPPGYYSSPYPPHHYPPHCPPPSYYPPPHGHGYHRSMPPPSHGGYPVQYAHGPGSYGKHRREASRPEQTLSHPHDSSGRSPPPSAYANDSNLVVRGHESSVAPSLPGSATHWQGGNTQGVQTYVIAKGVNDNRTMVPATAPSGRPEVGDDTNGFHHQTSSVSHWAPQVYMEPPDAGEHPLKGGHHRSTSSSISFLGLDVNLDNVDSTFLQNLHASQGAPPPPVFSHVEAPTEEQDEGSRSKLAQGGTSKRVRRKCTIEGCQNRVVQGGLCISHGAKRKLCKHPGCTKNVKKAGLCSTHGPARKRCDHARCNKVAVQGGRCIAHGAKKKICSVEPCTKQAILAGMCKKHHDQHQKELFLLPGSTKSGASKSAKPAKNVHKPTHTRGLSIFQEMSVDTVGDILAGEPTDSAVGARPPPKHRHQSTFSRDFGSLY